jgi:hypothetical protein
MTDLEAPGWDDIAERFERMCLHDARRRAGRWALATLRERLGEDWLGRAVERSDGSFPLGLHLLGSHTLAVVEALEWAQRLDLCAGWDGHGFILRDLRRDPRTARILHTRAQLLVAAVACQLGWGVALEPSGRDRPPADVHLSTPADEISVEVRVLTQSESGREQFAAAESGSEWLMMLGIQEHVWISGKLNRHPRPAERREIERFVRRNAAAAHSGEKPRLALDGIALALVDRAAAAGTLSGPTVRENLFERMVSAIAAKARRMQNSGAEWLHITVLTGLRAFTPWGKSPLAEKLSMMMAALDEALGDDRPAGIVLCSGAGLTPEVKAEDAAQAHGSALRRPINPLSGRETLIMAFQPSAQGTIAAWHAIADTEERWLEWALQRYGLPSVAELVSAASG